jgi:DNA (cytosine-5)-methyltransferase 1
VNELHLFAGAGGGILGGMLLGHTCVCAVEIEPYPRSVLLQRQRDGILPWFPIWDDVCTFDGRPWRGLVDIVCGGFPCQDISAAGKGAGITGERSGLWSEMARIIGEVRPRYAFVENSPMLTVRGLGVVLGDLAAMGYDARWGVVSAANAGAPHRRERIWIVADANSTALHAQTGSGWAQRISSWRTMGDIATAGSKDVPDADQAGKSEQSAIRCDRPESIGKVALDLCADLSDSDEVRCDENGNAGALERSFEEKSGTWNKSTVSFERCGPNELCDWWAVEPALGRVADGVAHRVDRLAAIGNGQVPAVAALAWRLLSGAP